MKMKSLFEKSVFGVWPSSATAAFNQSAAPSFSKSFAQSYCCARGRAHAILFT